MTRSGFFNGLPSVGSISAYAFSLITPMVYGYVFPGSEKRHIRKIRDVTYRKKGIEFNPSGTFT
ncbi:hypothetical protein [Oxalobacter formigenes]